MHEPRFWHEDSACARAVRDALWPAGQLYDLGQRLRQIFAHPLHARACVICVGNARIGGVGKTPFSIALADYLKKEMHTTCYLTRGYGGAQKGPLLADLQRHGAHEIGDEALLLAQTGIAIMSKNRRDGLRKADNLNTDYIIMDDGLQNPTIHKDINILLHPFNDDCTSALFPAGPMREPFLRARARADITVSIGDHKKAPWADFSAWLVPNMPPPPQRVVAFAGIGAPARFFDMLDMNGFDLCARFSYPDHHVFSDTELATMHQRAKREKARPDNNAKRCSAPILVRLE